jgi:hypothetical protein
MKHVGAHVQESRFAEREEWQRGQGASKGRTQASHGEGDQADVRLALEEIELEGGGGL